MKFKREHMKTEFWKTHTKLQYIIFDVALFVKYNFGKEIVVTSVYRPYNDKKWSVHNVWRGIDVRTRNLKLEEILAVVQYINEKYSYDPRRKFLKAAIHHNVGRGDHLHFQVHSNTKIRGEDK